ncbi:MAG: TlpA family protein disulfide reductase [Thermoleophilia bacterium]
MKPRSRILMYSLMLMAVAAAALMAGCGPSDSDKDSTATSNGSTQSSDRPQMPDFTLEKLGGGTMTRDDLLGTPIVLNFEASWCGPCEFEAPTFKTASETHTEVRFIGIAVKDSREAQQAFVTKYGWTFDIGMDFTGVVVTDFQQEALMPRGAIPTTFFIDSRGYIIDVYLGPISADELELQIAALVEADKANSADAAETSTTGTGNTTTP